MKKCGSAVTVLLVLAVLSAGCGDNGPEKAEGVAGAFILSTDYTTGGFSVVDLESRSVVYEKSGTVGSDVDQAVLHDGLIYVINRMYADNVQVIDPRQGFATIYQVSTGSGSNPYDIEFVDGKAYVSRYGVPQILVMSPVPSLSVTSPVDISAYADSDGNPEAAYLAEKNGTVFIALQRWVTDKGWPWSITTDGSAVAVLNTETSKIAKVIPLPVSNPVEDFVENPSQDVFYLPCAGYNDRVGDGGVVAIDPVALTASLEITESVLGGNLFDISISEDAATLFAIVATRECGIWGASGCKMSVVSYDFPTGSTDVIFQADGFTISDLEVNNGEIWIANNDFQNPGIVIVNEATGDMTRISTALPPVKILFLTESAYPENITAGTQ